MWGKGCSSFRTLSLFCVKVCGVRVLSCASQFFVLSESVKFALDYVAEKCDNSDVLALKDYSYVLRSKLLYQSA